MRAPDAVQADITLRLKKKVLDALAKVGVITYAARKAGVARQTVYDWCAADPDFKVAFDEALVASTELLETEAYRRAHDGVLKPVFQGGERVGSIREFSDTLLIFLLKARRPDVYRERVDLRQQLTGPDGGPLPAAGVVQIHYVNDWRRAPQVESGPPPPERGLPSEASADEVRGEADPP